MSFKSFKIQSLIYPLLLILILFSCRTEHKKSEPDVNLNEQAAYNPDKDAEIQRYNLELKKKQAVSRFPCDTISVIETILNTNPTGTYLLDFDRTLTYNIPKSAVIYHNDKDGKRYVFTVVGSSRAGERLIEPTNIIGYDQSFIDLDSTKLGTPFIYLVLYECINEALIKIWEVPIPSHGGFNSFSLKKWNFNGTLYVENNFHYAQGVGHINYNYFLVDGIRQSPHLLMTYKGIDFKRTIANVNKDKYPDYYEHIFYNLPDRIYSKDSVAFIWREKDGVYVNTRNARQTRPY
jgi:hypothetical protein